MWLAPWFFFMHAGFIHRKSALVNSSTTLSRARGLQPSAHGTGNGTNNPTFATVSPFPGKPDRMMSD
jgi:hypothetical protein